LTDKKQRPGLGERACRFTEHHHRTRPLIAAKSSHRNDNSQGAASLINAEPDRASDSSIH